ncbi:MAG: shikimate kinase AroK [Pseudomonadota bacterium]
MDTRSLFLVGPMGAGKSTTGRLLARTLGYEFIDSDKIVEERTGASIPLIFEIEGEEGFRQREIQAIEELTRQPGIVLATGGGAILRPENRHILRERGVVIYLHAPVEQQLQRTAHDKNRPLLLTDDRRGRLTELMRIREPLYRELAHILVDTEHLTPRRVVNQILRQLNALAR